MDDQKAERPRNPNGTFQVGQPRPEIPRRAKGVPTNKLTTLDIHKGILEAANRVGSDGRGTGGWVGYLESVYCGPVLRHSAEPIQAANFRSAVAF